MFTSSWIVNGAFSAVSGIEAFGSALNTMMRSDCIPHAAAASLTVARTSCWTKNREGFAALNWSANSSVVKAGFVVLIGVELRQQESEARNSQDRGAEEMRRPHRCGVICAMRVQTDVA
jgi:hypothetical protein